ncbi:hypothetical protein [Brevundimonas sp.]|uniref:hypothetical protein n=1 Tax=Brevundimonas sp. TaxID=1871086 RepID=UPI002D25A718|nr:hypothetical protein [Brevundimonas sp.]HYC67975.1 hypothetical protein [Brevundimonas sp.]
MARPRKPFLMRASSGVMAAVERLAAAELRSVNAQVEVLLREALARRGITPSEAPPAPDGATMTPKDDA